MCVWGGGGLFSERERDVIERERQPSGASGAGRQCTFRHLCHKAPSNKVNRTNGPK